MRITVIILKGYKYNMLKNVFLLLIGRDVMMMVMP